MWQRFTERSRRVVFFAQDEARQRRESYVSTEHLLLGLVRENDSVAARILNGIGIRLEDIRAQVEAQLEPVSEDAKPDDNMQLTPRAKRVIDLAYDEARQLNNNYIGTEHLLLGLIREGEGLAGRVLGDLGVTLERMRGEVTALQDAEPHPEKDEAANRVAQAIEEMKRRFAARRQAAADGEADNSPAVGDLGTLRSDTGRTVVEVAADSDAFAELVRAFHARDAFAYREMRDAGRFLLAPVGTPLKHLVPPADGRKRPLTDLALYVRLLDGPLAGRKGWIAAAEFERTGPDDAPFPPED